MVAPPPLRNDCFALPSGVDWTPVATALEHLKSALGPVVTSEDIPLTSASGRILAKDVHACVSNPPHANAAVDGYGFSAEAAQGEGPFHLPLVKGRSAAGAPYLADVPVGHAIRILTGAALPNGVDTIVLQEDVAVDTDEVAFHGPIKAGSNSRKMGEDFAQGDAILEAGRRLVPADLALMAAAGVGQVCVYAQLRVGVLSTGDEVRNVGTDLEAGQIYDANRPMLLSLLSEWGFVPVDLGRASDDRSEVRAKLDEAAKTCDVVLTSGGASAGDEDHLSALLAETDTLNLWRIAVKPGRPLALGVWSGCPVFGLPGNPVAALVCTLIFARPALEQLAGGHWHQPTSFMVPADFTKNKKQGRMEYLRARMGPNGAEVFASEGSGRISGLSWATGLVELPHESVTIDRGTPVKFIPYASFR